MASSSSTNVAKNFDTYTEVRTERIVHNWSIKRFDLLPEKVGEKIYSSWFYSQDKSEKWRLLLFPRGQLDSSSKDIDYIALFLARHSPGRSPMRVYVEKKISKSNIILRNSSITQEYGPEETRGSPRFLQRSKLLTTNPSDDDQFTISCIIDMPVEVIISSSDAIMTPIFDSKKTQLTDDFRSLFEDPIFSDFTIIVGDEKFPTHRNILAKRSPVFAAMFEHKDLQENHKKEVKIENIEPNVIKGMLEFMYTDQVINMKELASGLLEAADKYDLEKLKIMCEETLYEGLNKENAAELLLLADLHRADTLKKCVMKYIVDHAPEMLKSNNLRKIGRNPELLLELFQQAILPPEVMKKLKSQRHK